MKKEFKQIESKDQVIEALEESDEDVFRNYLYDLDLKPVDFDGKILDIGSGSARFAKWAKEHGISGEIYSLDNFFAQEEKSKSVRAEAEALPLKDNSFDLVVSHSAIPTMFAASWENQEAVGRRIIKALSEMLRVAKKGAEIRLAPITHGETAGMERHRRSYELLKDGLLSLKNRGVVIFIEKCTGKVVYEVDDAGNPTASESKYVVIIKKL